MIQNCGQKEITSIELGKEPSIYWKNLFHKNPITFRIIADSAADKGNGDDKVVGIKTTNIYKQNPVLNGYFIKSEIEKVLKSGYYESPLGYNHVDWYVD